MYAAFPNRMYVPLSAGPNGCLLKPHLVVFDKRDEETGNDLEIEYDVIVIRHGVKSALDELASVPLR